jgi:hypothetical protein
MIYLKSAFTNSKLIVKIRWSGFLIYHDFKGVVFESGHSEQPDLEIPESSPPTSSCTMKPTAWLSQVSLPTHYVHSPSQLLSVLIHSQCRQNWIKASSISCQVELSEWFLSVPHNFGYLLELLCRLNLCNLQFSFTKGVVVHVKILTNGFCMNPLIFFGRDSIISFKWIFLWPFFLRIVYFSCFKRNVWVKPLWRFFLTNKNLNLRPQWFKPMWLYTSTFLTKWAPRLTSLLHSFSCISLYEGIKWYSSYLEHDQDALVTKNIRKRHVKNNMREGV